MAPKIKGIHHVALKACGIEDYNKTLAFYRDILGMTVVRTWGEGNELATMLDTGSGLLEIFSNGTEYPGQGALRHLAFEVENTDACIQAVRAAGYTVTREPADLVIASAPPCPIRIGFCIGPVGEEVEFFQIR